jgi:hypothetical protein
MHGGMENADIFQCLAPHCGAFLFQKDAEVVTTKPKKNLSNGRVLLSFDQLKKSHLTITNKY